MRTKRFGQRELTGATSGVELGNGHNITDEAAYEGWGISARDIPIRSWPQGCARGRGVGAV